MTGMKPLVPRLCLGTHRLGGSASRIEATGDREFGRQSLRAVRSQAEPGNEESNDECVTLIRRV